MARAIYTLVLWLLLPLIGLRLLLRARKQPAYLRHVGERFGRLGRRAPGQLIWVHAVSVGETRASAPLIEALLARYPEHHILLTHMTPTGRATSAELFGDTHPRVLRAYLPYDYPFAVARFLDAHRPALGIIMETELWPNLFAACKARGVPLALVNARLSERSARGYGRIAPLVRGCLNALDLIAAQGEADAARLRALGAANVEVLGNLKFDIEPPADKIELGRVIRRRIGERAVWLAASTREGEEVLLLDALAQVPQDVLLLLVPRHPQRFDEVAREVHARGFKLQRRSEETPVDADTRVLLGDTMGEMFAYYAAADIAFIGGSLKPLGGQNLIEACVLGVPVLIGPHTFNFDAITTAAIDAGAARRVHDENALAQEVVALLDDGGARRAMGDAGRAFAGAHRGATDRTATRISALLG